VGDCHVNQIGGELVDGYSLGRAHIHQKQFTAESWTTHDGVEALRAHADSGQVICRRPRPGEGELVQSLVWVQPPEHLVA
jgi:ribulose bisphosphate carboxylase small subunit